MNHATNCKFCKCPITLEIDNEYEPLKDPQGIIPLASCNRCADLRVRKRKIEEVIKRACAAMAANPQMAETQRTANRETLISTTKAYTRLIADWIQSRTPFWSEDCVDLLMDKPAHWPSVLGQLWKMYRDSESGVKTFQKEF